MFPLTFDLSHASTMALSAVLLLAVLLASVCRGACRKVVAEVLTSLAAMFGCCRSDPSREISFSKGDLSPDSDGIWRSGFSRNKRMASEILLSNGLVERLDAAARDSEAIPPECFGTKNYLITDSIVDELYGDLVMRKLADAGLAVVKLVVPSMKDDETGDPSTEKSKTLDNFKKLTDAILERGITKNSCIISLGGGVINNVCGFVAGSLYRGIRLVHITTSCMGMLDAAIDFKQAVNHCCGKNLLGCYYPATKILIDPTMLATQSKRAIRNGIAEALKHGFCHSRELLRFILSGADDVSDAEYLEKLIMMTVALKVPTLTHYEDSNFNEMCPQYGHSVGHAVEFLSFKTKGQALLHGEGVSIGCCVSAEISLILGLCDQECVETHYDTFERMGLPTTIPFDQTIPDIISQMSYDKHYARKNVTMGLLTKVGSMYHKEGDFCHIIRHDTLVKALNVNRRRASCGFCVVKNQMPETP